MHDEGLRLVAQGNADAGLPKLRQASQLDPGNAQFRIDMLRESAAYARDLLRRGDAARAAGNLAEASDIYMRVLKEEPSNDVARRGLMAIELDARSLKLLAESERLLKDGQLDAAQDRVNTALADNPSNAAAQRQAAAIREGMEKQRQQRAAQSAARSVMTTPVTLQFRDANVRMVFEALSRTTGLNVIFDRDVRADLKTTIFVKDASVEDTVDLILLQNQLERRTLNGTTLFIYPATAAKQKEYQDLQVRTFQVFNIDVKYLMSVLKSVVKVKEISADERTGTIVMRDTADAIAVASKVIAAHDVPEPEVMLEVEVLEISHDRLTNLGVQLPDTFTIATPTTANTIGALKALTRNDLTVSGLSATLNLKLQDTDANLLASPRIRARNKEKARILIGDRVPIITNTVTPVTTGSVVTGSVQYQDVGLKLEFEPQVYSDKEVGIRINLEVSTIVKEISGPNGSLAYQIGTRNAQTVVRLRDGETQVLGGLISAEDRNTAAKVPGLGHLPVVGKLFGNNNGTNVKTEIVLSITPRIIRPPALLDASVRTVFSGTEGSLRERALQLEPVGSVRGQSTSTSSTTIAPTTAPSPASTSSTQVAPVTTTPAATTPAAAATPPPMPAPLPTPPTTTSQGNPNVRSLLQRMNQSRVGAGGTPTLASPAAASPATASAATASAASAPDSKAAQ
jgi:general secretion pathway protein D